MNSAYLALAARIRRALDDVQRVVDRAADLAGRAQRTGDDGFWDGVALNLHAFYVGIEHVLEAIARGIDGCVPNGPPWRPELHLQLSSALTGVRPAVLTPETRAGLDEFRAFRHIVRNVYTFNLRASRLEALVHALAPCNAQVRGDLQAFADLLERLANAGQT